MIRVTRFAVRRAAPLTLTPTLGAKAATARFSTSLIPERNLWDTIYSGTKGIVSLIMSEESRQKFMDVLNGSVINAEVLKQARFGNMLTLALFYDLQDPLFQKYGFDASDFLEGVKPALQHHHDTVAQLTNEFPVDTHSKDERTELLVQTMQQIMTRTASRKGVDGLPKADNAWAEQAQNDPDSLAGQLSKMVAPELLDDLFLAARLGSLTVNYDLSSTTISNVALLSARAMVMDEGEVYNGEVYDGIEDTSVEFKEETKSGSTDEEEAKPKAEKVVAPADSEEAKKSAMEASSSQESSKSFFEKKKESEEETKTSTMEASPSQESSKSFLEKKRESEAMAKMEASKDKESDKTVKMEASETEGTANDSSPEEGQIVEKQEMRSSTAEKAQANRDTTPVAAQIEVLYELNQTIEFKSNVVEELKEDDSERAKDMLDTKTSNEMQVLVGTFEGWLNGGPDGALRWRITQVRTPQADFPSM